MDARKLIGVFGTEVFSRVQGNLYHELHNKASQYGYNLILFSGTYDKVHFRETAKVTAKLYDLAENIPLSAYIIHAQSLGDMDLINRLIAMGKRNHIPVFVYDCDSLGITSSEGVYTINLDYKQGFAESVKHLIEYHQCKNIFMLGGMRNNKFSEDRIDAYREQMEAHGIPYVEEQIGYGDFWETPAIEAVNTFLDSGLPTPEAICCANDSMAITTIKVLKQRGIRVPEDVLVTGFDGIEDGKYNFPNISTCEPIMETVSDYIFGVLQGKRSEKEFFIPLRFFPKESCGCNCGFNLEDKQEMTVLVDNMRVNSWQHNRLLTMQFALIDSVNLEDVVKYMNYNLDIFTNYAHVFCFRHDMENLEDFTQDFGLMRVHMAKGMLPQKEFLPFDAKDILPEFEELLGTIEDNNIYFVRLIHNDDKLYGYHIIKSQEYSSNNLRLIGQFTESATIVIENIIRNKHLFVANQKLNDMYERLSEIYIKDTMTGLFNRHGYYQNLDDYVKREDLRDGYLHVVCVDMDGMKYINDNFGHLEGDLAIKAVATTIKECFPQPNIAARFGGDEFTVAVFTKHGGTMTTEQLSQKLNQYLKELPMLAGKAYPVVVSVGQGISKVSEITDYKLLEKMADDCMYIEKRKHKQEKK